MKTLKNYIIKERSVEGRKDWFWLHLKDENNSVLASAEVVLSNSDSLQYHLHKMMEKEREFIAFEAGEELENMIEEELVELDEFNTLESLEILLEICKQNKEKIVNGIDLLQIEATESGTGAGTKIVEYLKSNYQYVLLFSAGETDSYWVNRGFVEIYDGYYLYSQKENFPLSKGGVVKWFGTLKNQEK